MKKYITLLFLLISALGLSQELKRRASLGFTPVHVDSAMIVSLGLQDTKGVVVTQILPHGSMDALGAKKNDVLLKINNQEVTSVQDLLTIRAALREGDRMSATVWRDGKEKVLSGRAAHFPYETSKYSKVIYDHFEHKGGKIRTIINQPLAPGKHPIIFFIPGYNCTSIDNMHPRSPYRKLLDSLMAKGYAIFRMEKPGMGDNEDTGDCRQLGFHQELEAYLAGYDQIQKYDFVDTENIFLWGHSMGGLYAPLIAAEKQPKGVAFYGMVHDSWTEYLLRMVRYQNPRINASDYLETDRDIRTIYALLYEHYHLGKSSKELAQNPEYDKVLRRDFWFDGENQILLRHEDFWRELYEYSMTEAFHKFEGYVLSMNGEADLEVINDFSQREVVHIVNTFHPGKGEFYYLPKTDHMMIEVGTLEEGASLRYQARYRDLMDKNFNYDIVEKTHAWIQDKLDKSTTHNQPEMINDWYNYIDKSRIKESADNYTIHYNGETAGYMRYYKKVKDGKLIIQDTSVLTGMVWEKLDMVLDLADLQMHSGEILLKYPQNDAKMEGQVQWGHQTIAGEYVVDQQGTVQNSPVEYAAENRVLGRGAIFGLVTAMDVAVNQSFPIKMFAFSSGEIWQMELIIEGIEEISWQDKKVETYKMNLTGGKVDNILYMATDDTRKLYRIDVVGQNMQLVLDE